MNNHTPYCIFCGMGCDYMDLYDVIYQNTAIGQVKVNNSGLFTEFDCACQPKSKDLFRVVAQYDDKKVDLGICVPDGNTFSIKRMIPTKNIGKGTPRFCCVYLNHKPDNFIALSNDRKVPSLHKINEARFMTQDGIKGLTFSRGDQQESHQNEKNY